MGNIFIVSKAELEFMKSHDLIRYENDKMYVQNTVYAGTEVQLSRPVEIEVDLKKIPGLKPNDFIARKMSQQRKRR